MSDENREWLIQQPQDVQDELLHSAQRCAEVMGHYLGVSYWFNALISVARAYRVTAVSP